MTSDFLVESWRACHSEVRSAGWGGCLMIDLTQAEANLLLALGKHRTNDDSHRFSALRLEIPLQSVNQREHFLLDIGRGRIDLVKGTYQTRAKQTAILARLDFGGKPHRNPDGEEGRIQQRSATATAVGGGGEGV